MSLKTNLYQVSIQNIHGGDILVGTLNVAVKTLLMLGTDFVEGVDFAEAISLFLVSSVIGLFRTVLGLWVVEVMASSFRVLNSASFGTVDGGPIIPRSRVPSSTSKSMAELGLIEGGPTTSSIWFENNFSTPNLAINIPLCAFSLTKSVDSVGETGTPKTVK